MNTAVLYFTHILNDAIVDRYRDIKKASSDLGFDTWLLVDEDSIRDNFSCTEEYFLSEDDNVFLFSFFELKKKYKFYDCEIRFSMGNEIFPVVDFGLQNKYSNYWVIEYDTWYSGDWKDILSQYMDRPNDIVFQEEPKVTDSKWAWYPKTDSIFLDKKRNVLLNIYRLPYNFIRDLAMGNEITKDFNYFFELYVPSMALLLNYKWDILECDKALTWYPRPIEFKKNILYHPVKKDIDTIKIKKELYGKTE